MASVGTGLLGQYFDSVNFTNPRLTRTDASVNFNWGNGSPNSLIGSDTFSVRWTGKVQPLYSESYTFSTTTDDGVRLWVNNQLIIDKWVNQSAKPFSGSISLVAGQMYDIKLEYYENTGNASAQLAWSSASQIKQIIPQSQLYSTVQTVDVDPIEFGASTFSVNENGTAVAAVTVIRSGDTSAAASATLTPSNGTATSSVDYNNSPIVVNFNPGQNSTTVVIPIVNDGIYEPNETINLTLSNPSSGVLLGQKTTAVLTIIDNDLQPTVNLSSSALSLNEGNSGTTPFNFNVTLSNPSSQVITVPFLTKDGTAIAGSDYVANSGNLTFNPGETAKTVTVLVNGDTIVEPDETFTVQLGIPTNASLGTTIQSTATIVNDDVAVNPPPSTGISIFGSAATPSEIITDGTGSAGDYELGMEFKSAKAGQIQAIRYYKAPSETGTHIGRIWSSSGQLASITFTNETASGWQVQTLATPLDIQANTTYVVSVNTNSYYAQTENGLVTSISNGGLTASKGVYNDTPGLLPSQSWQNSNYFRDIVFAPITAPVVGSPGSLSFSAPTFSVNENGTPVSVVTVTRIGGSTGSVSATITPSSGTATTSSDYINTPIAVTFATGDTAAKTIAVPVVSDNIYEGNETVNLTLSNPTGGATLGTQTTVVLTIVDDDPLPKVSLSPSALSLNEGNSGTTPFNFNVTLSNPSSQVITVPFLTKDGTALAGSDYFANSGTLTFNPGETAKTVTVLVNGDTTVEPNENFTVNLGTPTNASLGTTIQSTATIVNDDGSTGGILSFSAPTFSVNENGTPVATVTVTRMGGSSGSVGATITPSNGTATAPSDYTNTPIAVNFAAGDTAAKTIVVPIINDNVYEGNETVNLTLSNPTGGATLGTQTTAVLTIVDDDPLPKVSLSPSALSLNEGNSGTIPFNFNVTLSNPSFQVITVPFLTKDGTAIAGSDYVANSGNLTFNPGETAKTVTVLVNGDTTVEPNENFTINLGSPTNATLGATIQSTATIVNDDSSVVNSGNNIDEFTGPFPSWANVKTLYGASGNGTTDDTQALQNALNDLGKTGKSSVLYLPTGTYKITKELDLTKARNVAIIGESPDLVTLSWAGATGGTILNSQNTAYSRVQRVTFDGNNTAGNGIWIQWDGQTANFPTTFDLSDNVFKELQVGIRGGEYPSTNGGQNTAAEVAIYRNKFIENSSAGILLNDWNTADFWIRDSLFENNNKGIDARIGNFNVYDSVFKNSKTGDISTNSTWFTGVRNNYSIGSPYFYSSAGPTGDGRIAVIQGNTILDTTNSAIQIRDPGPLSLFDNTIRNSAGNLNPAVTFGGFSPGDLIAVGNTFSVQNPISIDTRNNRFLNFDNTVVGRDTIAVSQPALPPTPQRATSPVIEVTVKTGAAIQAAINQAVQGYLGQRPIVHLSAGQYDVSSTIVVPAGSDLRLVGDVGFFPFNPNSTGSTTLVAQGFTGPVLNIKGPSHAVVQDIAIRSGSAAWSKGIVIDGADQPGGRILLNQVMSNTYASSGIGLRVEGLDYTTVDAINTGLGGDRGSVHVTGGPNAKAGQQTTARVNLVGGSSGSTGTGPSYNVDDGGRLLVRDVWYENGGTRTPMVQLSSNNSGTLTLDNMYQQYHTNAAGSTATMKIDGFTGQVTINGNAFLGSSTTVEGNNPEMDVLLLGSSFGSQNGFSSTFANTATAGQVSFLENRIATQGWGTPYPNQGTTDTTWLRSMLAPLRQETLADRSIPVPFGVTDLTLLRVGLESVTDGFVIMN